MTDAELAALPMGVQPEEDGLLVCLECGRWFRGLGNHVANAHDVSAEEYRRRHELPRRRSLWAADAREAAAARTRQRADLYPKATATRLRGTRAEAERAVAAQRESAQRSGTRALKRENSTRTAAQHRQRTRRKYDELAQDAGYAGVDDLIEQTRDQSAAALARILGVSVSGAKWLRRYHAAEFNLDHHPPKPDPVGRRERARIPRGVQPVTDTHILCRACGHWFKSLARHVGVKHGLDGTRYPRKFGLAVDLALVATAAAVANLRTRRDRLQQKATQLGYVSFADLIAKTRTMPAAEVAQMLDLTVNTIHNHRRRTHLAAKSRRLLDDLDGGVAHETVRFGLDGRTYEIDLSSKNAKKLRGELAVFVQRGSLVSARATSAARQPRIATRPAVVDRDLNQAIREWAQARGYEIALRGRIKQGIVDELLMAVWSRCQMRVGRPSWCRT